MSDTIYTAPEAEVLEAKFQHDSTRVFSLVQRIGRLRYLCYNMLFATGIPFLLGIVLAIVLPSFAEGGSDDLVVSIATVVFYIPLLFISVVLMVRRLHDLNQSGWLSLLYLVPLVNLFFALYLTFAKGTDGENQFGLRPAPNSGLVWVGALLLPVFLVGVLAAIAIPAYQDYTLRAQEALQQ